VAFICNNFDKAFLMPDADVAEKEVKKREMALLAHGMWSVETIHLKEGDPGDLTDEQAAEVMGEMGF
jgi:hypothetical protein